MKQVVQNLRSGILKIDEVPAPQLTSGSVLVMNHYSMISSGTEKSTVQVARKNLVGKAMDRPDMVKKVLSKVKKDGLFDTLKMVFERLDAPAALGYSCSGTVLRAGGDAPEFSTGDKVACAGQNYASHAGVVAVPKNLCVAIPDGVELVEASFVALGAIALQGVRQAEPRIGERVAVLGLGLLGQLTVQLLKASGCQVIASDLDSVKLELARTNGADRTALPGELLIASLSFSQGYGVDAVIITAGSKDNFLVEIAGEIARKRGKVVVVGAVGMNIPRESYYKKELELKLSASYGPGRYDTEYEEKGRDYPIGYVRWTEKRNMEAFLNLVAEKKLNLKSLISHRFLIDEADKAYQLMMEGIEPYLGILISYPLRATQDQQAATPLNAPREIKKVNLGLIGAGNHVKDMLLPPLKAHAEVSFQMICTGTGIHAKGLAEKLKAPECTTDYNLVIQNRSVNAVIIGTRHNLHAHLVVEALKMEKHVFVEKPLCLTDRELDEIIAIYEKQAAKGIQLAVGFNRRYSPHMDRARDFFKGRQNPLVMVYRVNAGELPLTHWSQDPEIGGGRIVGEACHFIDYMAYLCGANPVSVQAKRIARSTHRVTDDQSIILLTFADGSIGTVIYTAGGDTSLPKERFEAFGDQKSLVMNDFIQTEFYEGGKRKSFKTGKRDKGFEKEMNLFVDSIICGREFMSFDRIRTVTLATLRAVESMQTGEVYEL